MQDITSFFGKFKSLIANGSAQREAIARIMKESIGAEIDPKKIVIKDGIATVPSNPVMRNELLLKKQLVLEKLKSDPATAGLRGVK
ncbi:MAG TPA: hypothetical protein VHF05_01645 [Candidatus Paceibacterota bacterium]|jgi:hypothetical protein|nr:hypothetical protein [Candidatus Paceibacterota bacterium]